MSTSRTRPRIAVIAGLVVAQLGLVALAVAPQLSARLTGETFLLAVQPIDPIDPFRGAYVTLEYPGIDRIWEEDPTEDTDWQSPAWESLPSGPVYAALVPAGELHDVGEWSTVRPDESPFLACRYNGWEINCGIGSFFVSQDRATELEAGLTAGNGVAEIRVDSRGNATVVNVEAQGR